MAINLDPNNKPPADNLGNTAPPPIRKNPFQNFLDQLALGMKEGKEMEKTTCSNYCLHKWEEVPDKSESIESLFKERCEAKCEAYKMCLEFDRVNI